MKSFKSVKVQVINITRSH